jgi:hypothetical protein
MSKTLFQLSENILFHLCRDLTNEQQDNCHMFMLLLWQQSFLEHMYMYNPIITRALNWAFAEV